MVGTGSWQGRIFRISSKTAFCHSCHRVAFFVGFFCKALKNGCHFSACNIFDMFFPVIGNEFHIPLTSCMPGFSRFASFVGIKTEGTLVKGIFVVELFSVLLPVS